MKSDDTILSVIKELQELRGGIPTFVLSSGFGGSTVIKIRKSLLGVAQADEVDIILHSGGGSADDAYRLIRTFRSRYKVVNVIVPFWAKSAATIFAFGGNRIVLHEFGELGPLDAQIKKNDDDGLDTGYASALNVQSSLQQIEDRARVGVIEMFRTVSNNPDIRISKKQLFEMLLSQSSQFYEPLLQKIDTMEIGSMARYLAIGAMYARRILTQYSTITDSKMAELLDFLVYESPDHGYVVDYSILHQYLDSAMIANEPPFDQNYYDTLDRLSLLLMQSDLDKVGFIDELHKPTVPVAPTIPPATPAATTKTTAAAASAPTKPKRDKIEVQDKETNQGESNPDSSTSKAQRANGKSDADTGQKKPRENQRKRKTSNGEDATPEANTATPAA